jgi:hypothetical protein
MAELPKDIFFGMLGLFFGDERLGKSIIKNGKSTQRKAITNERGI